MSATKLTAITDEVSDDVNEVEVSDDVNEVDVSDDVNEVEVSDDVNEVEVTDRESSSTPSRHSNVFRPHCEVMTASDMERALRRIAHEVIERNRGDESVVVIGLQTGGVFLAQRLGVAIADATTGTETEAELITEIPVGMLDVALHRDDIGLRPVMPQAVTHIPVNLDGKVVVLVDDVLFTGRTVRAALDALHAWGRPKAIQLAVMVDRGHRELPIRPDFVGKNLPTRHGEMVDVQPDGVQLGVIVPSSTYAAGTRP